MLPFARFPGADPVLGPEMRSTGEVMASAADFPTAFAKAERAAGRPLPADGTAFLSVRDADKPAAIEVAASLSSSASALVATAGTAHALAAAGLAVERVRKVAEDGEGPTVVDLVRRGRCDLVVNTPFGDSGARSDGYLIREAALAARIPCITTIAGAARGRRTRSPTRRATSPCRCRSGSVRRSERLSVVANEAVGPYALLRVERGGSSPAFPDSSSCSRRPVGCCRGR